MSVPFFHDSTFASCFAACIVGRISCRFQAYSILVQPFSKMCVRGRTSSMQLENTARTKKYSLLIHHFRNTVTPPRLIPRSSNALSSDRRASALSPDPPQCVVLLYSCSQPSYPNTHYLVYHTCLSLLSLSAFISFCSYVNPRATTGRKALVHWPP